MKPEKSDLRSPTQKERDIVAVVPILIRPVKHASTASSCLQSLATTTLLRRRCGESMWMPCIVEYHAAKLGGKVVRDAGEVSLPRHISVANPTACGKAIRGYIAVLVSCNQCECIEAQMSASNRYRYTKIPLINRPIQGCQKVLPDWHTKRELTRRNNIPDVRLSLIFETYKIVKKRYVSCKTSKNA